MLLDANRQTSTQQVKVPSSSAEQFSTLPGDTTQLVMRQAHPKVVKLTYHECKPVQMWHLVLEIQAHFPHTTGALR